MNNQNEMIQAVVAQEPVAFRAAFDLALAERIAGKIEDLTPTVSQSMFSKED